jgi:hypothetical protein
MSLNFNNYQPETFGWTKTNGDNDPYSYHGVEIAGGINKAPGYRTLMSLVLDALVPHIPGGLVPGWCWGGTTSDRVSDSFHLYALAFDLNAPVNPMSSTPPNWGADHVMPPNAGDIVRPFGFEWGGNWDASTPPDYMHFEFTGSPDEIGVILAQHHAPSTTPTPPPVHTPPPAPGHAGAFPLPAGYYFGPLSGPNESVSGMSSSEGTMLAPHRAEIAQLQRALNFALIAAHRPVLIVDGQYGPHTQGAVTWYQSTHGLTADGLAGPATWARLAL